MKFILFVILFMVLACIGVSTLLSLLLLQLGFGVG